jgi:hypothetical protein
VKSIGVICDVDDEQLVSLFQAQGRSKGGLFHALPFPLSDGGPFLLKLVGQVDLVVMLLGTAADPSPPLLAAAGSIAMAGCSVVVLRSNRSKTVVQIGEFPTFVWSWANVQRIASARFSVNATFAR